MEPMHLCHQGHKVVQLPCATSKDQDASTCQLAVALVPKLSVHRLCSVSISELPPNGGSYTCALVLSTYKETLFPRGPVDRSGGLVSAGLPELSVLEHKMEVSLVMLSVRLFRALFVKVRVVVRWHRFQAQAVGTENETPCCLKCQGTGPGRYVLGSSLCNRSQCPKTMSDAEWRIHSPRTEGAGGGGYDSSLCRGIEVGTPLGRRDRFGTCEENARSTRSVIPIPQCLRG